ncbi:hypothetical protein BDW68DRAFT_178879 [Aspergillus falconensis]
MSAHTLKAEALTIRLVKEAMISVLEVIGGLCTMRDSIRVFLPRPSSSTFKFRQTGTVLLALTTRCLAKLARLMKWIFWDAAIHENSPAELAPYWERYQDFIAGLSDHPSARKLAHDSLVIHKLKIAADGPVCTGHIIERIFEEIRAKTSNTQSAEAVEQEATGDGARLEEKEQKAEDEGKEERGDDKNDEAYGDYNDSFYLYNVYIKLATEKLEDEQHQRLVDGFRLRFLHETSQASGA